MASVTAMPSVAFMAAVVLVVLPLVPLGCAIPMGTGLMTVLLMLCVRRFHHSSCIPIYP